MSLILNDPTPILCAVCDTPGEAMCLACEIAADARFEREQDRDEEADRD